MADDSVDPISKTPSQEKVASSGNPWSVTTLQERIASQGSPISTTIVQENVASPGNPFSTTAVQENVASSRNLFSAASLHDKVASSGNPFSPTPLQEKVNPADNLLLPTTSKDIVNPTEKQKGFPSLRDKIVIGFAICVLVCVCLFILVLTMSSIKAATHRAVCVEIMEREQAGKSKGYASSTPSIHDIHMCNSLKCALDLFSCHNPCPFGFELGEDDCPKSCECGGSGVRAGDIQFDETDVPTLLDEFGYLSDNHDFANEIRSASIPRWRRKNSEIKTGPITISYTLDKDLTSEQITSWQKAINQLQAETCIRFTKWTDNAQDYLFVTKSKKAGCKTYIGRKGGRQKIVMGRCFSPRHVEHMLMHVLGFYHEHSRSDRDSYIKIKLENVMKQHKEIFRKIRTNRHREYPTEFDEESVTMLHGYSFSTEEGKKATILDAKTKRPLLIEDKDKFSEKDIMDINHVYCKDVQAPNDTLTAQTRSSDEGDTGLGPMRLLMTEFSWSYWGLWSKCDRPCGQAIKRRYRQCRTKDGFSMGPKCPGQNGMTLPCKALPCPRDFDRKPRWKPWASFGTCSKTCDTGVMYRSRECSDGKSDGGDCEGSTIEGKRCNTLPCYANQYNRFDPWSEWSECTATCGGGKMTRFRECKTLQRERARYCSGRVGNDGMQYHTKVCSLQSCDIVFRSLKPSTDSESSKALENPAWFSRLPTQISASVCEPGEDVEWIVGDFNGDKKDDILCKHEGGKAKIVLTDHLNRLRDISWEGDLGKCVKNRLYSGDFNGDHTSDILCVAMEATKTVMLIFTIRNGKAKEPIRVGDLCIDAHWTLYIVDANGDGKDDILCRDEMVEPNKISKIHLNVLEI